MPLPKKINPCPIIEAIAEIRFDPLVETGAVFGIFYNIFKDEYSKTLKLPILQLPEEIRSKDPSLIYKPLYNLFNGNFILSIGPKVIGLSCRGEYVGWDVYSKKIELTIKKVKRTNIFNKIERLGLRYINLFDNNVFENIKLNININGKPLKGQETYFKTSITSNGFTNILQITEKAALTQGSTQLFGSVIDIDTHIIEGKKDIYSNTNMIIEKAHNEEKKLFFKLLKDDFLKTLNPIY